MKRHNELGDAKRRIELGDVERRNELGDVKETVNKNLKLTSFKSK